MNSWGVTGASGASAAGGALVSSNDRTKEKTVRCGGGIVISLGFSWIGKWLFSSASSHTSRLRGVSGDIGEGNDDGGYKSNKSNKRSTISCRVATSPGFLSE